MTSAATVTPSRDARAVLVQILILAALCLALLRSEFEYVWWRITEDSENSHAFVVPLMVFLLIWLRRHVLRDALSRGSAWGIALLLGSVFVYAAAQWPFNYGYPRQAAGVGMLGGCVLAVAGWRVFWRSMPILLLVLLAVPLGARLYAFLIVIPETATLRAAEIALDLLPGVHVTLEGVDLTYHRSGTTGAIALGEPHRGASLFLSYLTLGAFVTFSRIRPVWQVIVAAILAAPLILLGNFLRLFLHGVVTIYGGIQPYSPMPRLIAYATSFLMMYGMIIALFAILNRVVQPADAPTAS